MSRSPRPNRSRERVKYFFLGALAPVFLYGFALIYGGTGSTNLNDNRRLLQRSRHQQHRPRGSSWPF